ncbi:MAG: glycosyltransferase family 1 protein [Zavarzinella sp.]
MKVALNVLSTVGKRTGIGHYTAELLKELHLLPGCTVKSFPTWWMQSIRAACFPDSGKMADVPAQRTGFSLPPALRTWAATAMRRTWWTAMAAQARHQLRPEQVDLYHEPNFAPLPAGVPVVVTVHDLSPISHPQWHPTDRVQAIEANLVRTLTRMSHFFTVSQAMKDEMIARWGIEQEKITVTYNGVRTIFRTMLPTIAKSYCEKLGLPENFLLHVGTIEPRKNLEMLMRAYVNIPANIRQSCPLVLVGRWGWKTETIARYFQETARHQGVIHLGYTTEQELAALTTMARALVYPSLYEGFGMPAAEKMASGGAVLGSTATAIAEVLGPCGTTLDPADQQSWTQAMKRAITDNEWLTILKQGTTTRSQQFTWKNCAEQTMLGYHRALGMDRVRHQREDARPRHPD